MNDSVELRLEEIAGLDNISEEILSETQKLVEQTKLESELPLAEDSNSREGGTEDIRSIIRNATLPKKIKLALLGNATCRTLLIRDSNKMIQQFVLKNPRLQITEVEEFGKNPNLSEIVLRSIGNNSAWMKSYSLKLSIVTNPKVPQDISLKWVKFLNVADLRKIAKSKNVPHLISIAARKRIAEA